MAEAMPQNPGPAVPLAGVPDGSFPGPASGPRNVWSQPALSRGEGSSPAAANSGEPGRSGEAGSAGVGREGHLARVAEARQTDGRGAGTALGMESEAEPLAIAGRIRLLPVAIAVAIPIRDFRVRNLLAIGPGDVVATQWGQGEDLPLASGALQLAWTEFEVADSELAVRITRLA